MEITEGNGGAGSISRRTVWIVVGAWVLVAAFFSAQNVVRAVVRGDAVPWLGAVGLELLYWLPWILLTPLLLHLSWRFPFGEGRPRRALLAHGLGSVGVPLLQVTLFLGLQLALFLVLRGGGEGRLERMTAEFAAAFPVLALTAFWKYWVFVGVYHAFLYHRRSREREVRESQLEAELAKARLQELEARLHPHFLFNTLHAASMLNLSDPGAANALLVKLSDLLRITLDRQSGADVTVRAELGLLDRYLEIEQLRFQDRLEVEYRVEPEAEEALVPNLILQPLVENALRHAVEDVAGGRVLGISARREARELVLEVEDCGPGLPEGWSLQHDGGRGLRSVRERLVQRFGPSHRFEMESQNGEGLLVRLTFPFRTGAMP